MLAFNKSHDKDILLALVYPDAQSTKPINEIWYTHKYEGDSQIVNDDVESLLKYEQLRVMKQHNITRREYRDLLQLLKEGVEVNEEADRSMKKAYLDMRITLERKLKKEIIFDAKDKAYLRINYDTTEPKTNYIIGVFGASGSGKSYSVCQTVLRDPALVHYENVFLVGAVGEDDISYEPLKEKMFERYHYMNSDDITGSQLKIRDYAKSCVILDDIDSTADPRKRRAAQLFRDRLLQTARHYSTRVISTSHLFNGYRETSKIRNSARWIFIFPRSIPHTLIQTLEKDFNFKREAAHHMLKMCQRDGRLTVVSKNHPQFLMTPKRIILL